MANWCENLLIVRACLKLSGLEHALEAHAGHEQGGEDGHASRGLVAHLVVAAQAAVALPATERLLDLPAPRLDGEARTAGGPTSSWTMPWRASSSPQRSAAKPRSIQARRRAGWAARSGARAASASRACTSAGTARTPSGSPSPSTISTRLRPLTFLWASYPRGPRCGPVLTLWASMIAAVGRRFRPAARRQQATRT